MQLSSVLTQYAVDVAKPGQKPLTELDEYRYVEAVEKFGGQGSKSPMEIDDIKALVEWKL